MGSVLVAIGRELDLDQGRTVEHPKGSRADAGFNRRIQGELTFTNRLASKDKVHCIAEGRIRAVQKVIEHRNMGNG